jgi:acetyl/propionyl-CoA carboxylase alpha subunit
VLGSAVQMVKGREIGKLLIANRGEIALRIIRSAKTLGIRTVAVFSEADAKSPHVAAADEAVCIGPPEASKSYLNSEVIIAAARTTGADAIHPGYGFLSERPEFARAVAEAGIVFVGPPAEVMAALGDKLAGRRIAREAGVPMVPGAESASPADIRAFAAREGYPILIKASAGGGGRGMRIVGNESELEAALEAGSREARAAFGDGRVFVEKYLARPRHVEVQILGDSHGNLVALGERDCSIQRRYQKIIEESPAPGLSDATRTRMYDAALALGRAVGYVSAGTVEFLVDGDKFYFLEVNTRLQVEHPVTELRFACDLVAEQLRIAAGERVSEVGAPVGAAIECRINAEDAANSFRPATGTVIHLATPAGPGVRFDSHLEAGLEVASHYDSLLGKLITFGASREQARRRMVVALGEFSLLGVTNTAGFLRDIVASEPFARGDLSTHFLEEFFPRWHPAESDGIEAAMVAAAMVASGAFGIRSGRAPAPATGPAVAARRSPWDELSGFELWRSR